MGADISFDSLLTVIGNKLGTFRVPCPVCSPLRQLANRKKTVLRVWYERPDFLTYCCHHCDARGYARDSNAKPIERHKLRKLVREADERHISQINERRRRARWLWQRSEPIKGNVAERYLRGRGIRCDLPATLRFCPARGEYPPALIATFGIPAEPIPGILSPDNVPVHGVHITRLQPNGRGKAPDSEGRTKLMLGPSMGLPIICAPVNDLGGLAICEGIEDALSVHQATGLGAWAAGCANRLPPLARSVPRYVESVRILVDDDDAGRKHAHELADRLQAIRGRRFEITVLDAGRWRVAA